jgi:hypothetical protein
MKTFLSEPEEAQPAEESSKKAPVEETPQPTQSLPSKTAEGADTAETPKAADEVKSFEHEPVAPQQPIEEWKRSKLTPDEEANTAEPADTLQPADEMKLSEHEPRAPQVTQTSLPTKDVPAEKVKAAEPKPETTEDAELRVVEAEYSPANKSTS